MTPRNPNLHAGSELDTRQAELPELESAELLAGTLTREERGDPGADCPGLVAQTLPPFQGPDYPFCRQTLNSRASFGLNLRRGKIIPR